MNGFEKYTDYKTVLSVNALVWAKDKVLLLKRSADKKVDPNLYSGIGGKVEPGEDFYSVTQHPYPPTNAEWVNLYFTVEIEKQVKIPANKDGKFFWFDPKKTASLPMPMDTQEYIQILSKNPKAFIFGFFDHDKEGKLIEKKIKVL